MSRNLTEKRIEYLERELEREKATLEKQKKVKEEISDTLFCSIKEASRITGLSENYIRNGAKDGSIPTIYAGKKYMINMALFQEELYKKSLRIE